MRYLRPIRSLDPEETRSRRRARTGLFAIVWEFTSVLGRAAVAVIALIFSLVLLARLPEIHEKADELLPEPVKRLFGGSKTAAREEETGLEKLRSKVLGAVDGRRSTAARSRTFGIGSSKDEVLEIQGKPAKIVGDVWYYGNSQVEFIGDRVAGWSESSSQPLRVR